MLGIDFEAEGSQVDEHFDGRPENPEELVMHLAKLKAEAVAKNHTDGIVIGFDSSAGSMVKCLKSPSLGKKPSTDSNSYQGMVINFTQAFTLLMFLTVKSSEQP